MYTSGTHAKLPIRATNLSRSLAPAMAMMPQMRVVPMRRPFLYHFVARDFLPEACSPKRVVSRIRAAGKSCTGVPARTAME